MIVSRRTFLLGTAGLGLAAAIGPAQAEIDPARGADRLEYQLSLVEGWGNVMDEQGNAVPFSQETLRAAVATDAAFAYTVASGPWPGGADARAVRLAAALGRTLG